MGALRRIKRKLTEGATANPHRQRYLIKHQKVVSEIDPKSEDRKRKKYGQSNQSLTAAMGNADKPIFPACATNVQTH